jgi:peptidoglycan/xylan/chitin deacetylase (PgdA/CDA1 family)
MYHHVSPSSHDEADKVTPEQFRGHLELIDRFGFDVVSLGDYVDRRRAGEDVARKSLVITFDDGYEDNYIHAFPALKEFGYPATIFMHVEKIGTPGYLTWDQLKEMQRHGITIASHTLSHPYMPAFPREHQLRELVESKNILEEGLNASVELVAYPVGAFSELTKSLARQAGYKAGLTTNRGYNVKNNDFFELKRVRMSNSDDTRLDIWVKLAGYANVFKKGKKPY